MENNEITMTLKVEMPEDLKRTLALCELERLDAAILRARRESLAQKEREQNLMMERYRLIVALYAATPIRIAA